MSILAKLRSHAIGQQAREMTDDPDTFGKQSSDREWQRLRRVDAAARRAVQVWGQEGEAEALEALVAALEGRG